MLLSAPHWNDSIQYGEKTKQNVKTLLSSSSLTPGPQRSKLAQIKMAFALGIVHEATKWLPICLKESEPLC